MLKSEKKRDRKPSQAEDSESEARHDALPEWRNLLQTRSFGSHMVKGNCPEPQTANWSKSC
jgi:hypothetical protein